MRLLRHPMIRALGAVCILGLLAGCQDTHQARSVETSGFLKNYQQLKPGKDDQEALRLYINPKTNFTQYNTILLEPIKLYAAEGSFFIDASPETRQSLVNYLDAAIRQELTGPYQFVKQRQPGTMVFRVAITDAQGSNVALDTVSSIVPIGLAISALKSGITGKGTAVGSCSIEFEALDAVSGERLFAAVDKRIGAKFTGEGDKFEQWHAVKSAFDYWANRLQERLVEQRAKATRPTAK